MNKKVINKNQMQLHISIIISLVLMMGCQTKPDKSIKSIDKMNILWVVAEDLGPYIPPFGDSTIKTPNFSTKACFCLHNSSFITNKFEYKYNLGSFFTEPIEITQKY